MSCAESVLCVPSGLYSQDDFVARGGLLVPGFSCVSSCPGHQGPVESIAGSLLVHSAVLLGSLSAPSPLSGPLLAAQWGASLCAIIAGGVLLCCYQKPIYTCAAITYIFAAIFDVLAVLLW